MNAFRIALASSLLLSPLAAQGALPLDGTYVFSELQGEHGSDCGGPPIFQMVGSQSGTVAFAPDGTATLSETEHGACEDGSFSTGSSTFAAPYTVGVDGSLTFNPGPDEFHAALRPDLSTVVGAGDTPSQGPSLLLATRLSSGLDASVLSGLYLFAKIVLVNDGTGLRSEVWYGVLSFDGSGGYGGSGTLKAVDSFGATVTSTPPMSGTYTVAADGKLQIDGDDGGVTADGEMFHVVDTTGQDVSLLFGVKMSGGATDAQLGGSWSFGDFLAELGPAAGLPEFCSSFAGVDLDAGTKTYAIFGDEICADPLGESFAPFAGSGTFNVFVDGSFLVYDGGSLPGITGGVDPSGTRALLADISTTGEVSASFLVRGGELPTPFGTATPGTGGVAPTLASSGGFAYLGNSGFAFEIAQALPGAQAFLGVSVQPGAGFPLLGGTLWLDPLTPVLTQPVAIGGGGGASVPIPIPPTAALDGEAVHAQALVVDPGGPAGFAMSAGLKVPLMR